MTLVLVTDFCAAKVRQISTHGWFANVLNGDSMAVEIYWAISPIIEVNFSDLSLYDGFLCCKILANKHTCILC